MESITIPGTESIIAYPKPFEFFARQFVKIATEFKHIENYCHLHVGMCLTEQDLLFFLKKNPNYIFIIYIHDAPYICRNSSKSKLTFLSMWNILKNYKIQFGVTFTRKGLTLLQQNSILKFVYLPHLDYHSFFVTSYSNKNISINSKIHTIAGYINGYKGHLNLLFSIIIANFLSKQKHHLVIVGDELGMRGRIVKSILKFFSSLMPSIIFLHDNVIDEDFITFIMNTDYFYCIHKDEPGYYSSSGPASLALSFGKTVFFKSQYKFDEFSNYCPKLANKYRFINSILNAPTAILKAEFYKVNHIYVDVINSEIMNNEGKYHDNN